jgi:hypothetical protein
LRFGFFQFQEIPVITSAADNETMFELRCGQLDDETIRVTSISVVRNHARTFVTPAGTWNRVIWGWINSKSYSLPPGEVFKLLVKIRQFFDGLVKEEWDQLQNLRFTRKELNSLKTELPFNKKGSGYQKIRLKRINRENLWNTMQREVADRFMNLTITDNFCLELKPIKFKVINLR